MNSCDSLFFSNIIFDRLHYFLDDVDLRRLRVDFAVEATDSMNIFCIKKNILTSYQYTN